MCNVQKIALRVFFLHVLPVDNHTTLLLPLYFNSALLDSIMSLVCDWRKSHLVLLKKQLDVRWMEEGTDRTTFFSHLKS